MWHFFLVFKKIFPWIEKRIYRNFKRNLWTPRFNFTISDYSFQTNVNFTKANNCGKNVWNPFQSQRPTKRAAIIDETLRIVTCDSIILTLMWNYAIIEPLVTLLRSENMKSFWFRFLYRHKNKRNLEKLNSFLAILFCKNGPTWTDQ